MTDPTANTGQPKRARRGEPITTRVAKNGTKSYEFRLDVGVKPDGSRDRRRFTYPTAKEARKELRRISTEVHKGTYTRPVEDHRGPGVRSMAGGAA